MIKSLLILLVVFSLLSCKGPKQEREKNYRIAYNVFEAEKDGKSDYEVYLMDMDGKHKKNILHHPDVAWTYYAYRNNLYFISDRDTCYRCYFLYVTPDEGKTVHKVSDLRLEDSWMSSRMDGMEMVVAGRIGTSIRYQLFLINTQTGKYRQITTDTAAMYRDPLFSPDGQQIVYAYKANRRDRNHHEELYIMKVDGTGVRQLTYYPQNDSSLSSYHYKAGPPRWNSKEDLISYHSHQAGKYSLYAVTPDGSRHWKLTDHLQEEGWHDWSSDGKWLVIEFFDPEQTEFDIALMDWETRELTMLTDTTYKYEQAPVFVEVINQ